MPKKLTALRTVRATTEKLCVTGKRNAVDSKSRTAVANSALVLRRPTSPQTAGRRPEASPPFTFGVDVEVEVDIEVAVEVAVAGDFDSEIDVDANSSQLKSWAVARCDSGNFVAASPTRVIDDSEINEMCKFFQLLNQWDLGTVK